MQLDEDIGALISFSLYILDEPNSEQALKDLFRERLRYPDTALALAPRLVKSLEARRAKASAFPDLAKKVANWQLFFSERINAPLVRPLIAASNHIDHEAYSIKYWDTEWTMEHERAFMPFNKEQNFCHLNPTDEQLLSIEFE